MLYYEWKVDLKKIIRRVETCCLKGRHSKISYQENTCNVIHYFEIYYVGMLTGVLASHRASPRVVDSHTPITYFLDNLAPNTRSMKTSKQTHFWLRKRHLCISRNISHERICIRSVGVIFKCDSGTKGNLFSPQDYLSFVLSSDYSHEHFTTKLLVIRGFRSGRDL